MSSYTKLAWMGEGSSRLPTPRLTAILLCGLTLILAFGSWAFSLRGDVDSKELALLANLPTPRVHLLLTANNPDPNLCKTLFTADALGYPTPSIVAWGQTFDEGGLLGGGSHLAKIAEVLKYLTALGPENDEDLVMLLDAYDIWFQLPLEVLLGRYRSINAAADERLAKRLGREAVKNNFSQNTIFAAGKRCAPNQVHTIACYPIPQPPVSMSLYGANTDTIIGRNKYYSHRQRYLNSGYIMGPAAQLRQLLTRAAELVREDFDHDPEDNGSHGSERLYHGSDQSIFNIILGQQEYQREVFRRSHGGRFAAGRGPVGNKIEGTPIDDLLNPSFTHELFEAQPDVQYEYHLGLDYLSDLGHQTANSELDARYLVHSQPLEPQIHGRNRMDCPLHSPMGMPQDLLATPAPYNSIDLPPDHELAQATWSSVPLYTHLCYGTVPVMIHHNGDKSARDRDWTKLWLQSNVRALGRARESAGNGSARAQNFSEHMLAPSQRGTGGAWADDGNFLAWDELCPELAAAG